MLNKERLTATREGDFVAVVPSGRNLLGLGGPLACRRARAMTPLIHRR